MSIRIVALFCLTFLLALTLGAASSAQAHASDDVYELPSPCTSPNYLYYPHSAATGVYIEACGYQDNAGQPLYLYRSGPDGLPAFRASIGTIGSDGSVKGVGEVFPCGTALGTYRLTVTTDAALAGPQNFGYGFDYEHNDEAKVDDHCNPKPSCPTERDASGRCMSESEVALAKRCTPALNVKFPRYKHGKRRFFAQGDKAIITSRKHCNAGRKRLYAHIIHARTRKVRTVKLGVVRGNPGKTSAKAVLIRKRERPGVYRVRFSLSRTYSPKTVLYSYSTTACQRVYKKLSGGRTEWRLKCS